MLNKSLIRTEVTRIEHRVGRIHNYLAIPQSQFPREETAVRQSRREIRALLESIHLIACHILADYREVLQKGAIMRQMAGHNLVPQELAEKGDDLIGRWLEGKAPADPAQIFDDLQKCDHIGTRFTAAVKQYVG